MNITDPVTRSIFKEYGSYLHDQIDEWVRLGAKGSLIEWIKGKIGGTASIIKTGTGKAKINQPVKISNKLVDLYSKELEIGEASMPPYMCFEPIHPDVTDVQSTGLMP